MLSVGGQMAARISGFVSWSRTPLGPLEEWPISLRSAAAMVLENRFPMAMFWGPELLHLYNDGYVPVLGGKHPAALGQPASVVWAEIWPIIGAQLAHVYEGRARSGTSTCCSRWTERVPRRGLLHLLVQSGAATTRGRSAASWSPSRRRRSRSQDERQLQMLRDLGAEGIEAESVAAACRTAAGVLGRNDADIPFALIYLVRPGRDDAELVASAGLDRYEGPANPPSIAAGARRKAGRSPRRARRRASS